MWKYSTMRTIITLLAFLIIGCVESSEKEIPFYNNDKIPIIEGSLNNKKVYFIVDSGASISVLDVTQSKKYGFSTLKQSNTVVGFGGKSSYVDLQNTKIFIKDLQLNTSFKGNDLSLLIKTIEQNSNVTIIGIIGSDVFKENGMKIDYLSNSIKY